MTETVINPELQEPTDPRIAVTQPTDDEAIDENLLAEATRGLGLSSRSAAVNTLLREYVMEKRRRRLEAFDRLQQRAEEEDLDFDAIEEAEK